MTTNFKNEDPTHVIIITTQGIVQWSDLNAFYIVVSLYVIYFLSLNSCRTTVGRISIN